MPGGNQRWDKVIVLPESLVLCLESLVLSQVPSQVREVPSKFQVIDYQVQSKVPVCNFMFQGLNKSLCTLWLI